MSDNITVLITSYFATKAVTKKEGQIFFLTAPKMVSFLQLEAEKKTPFTVQLEFFSVLLIL